jgi:hypothetical protein
MSKIDTIQSLELFIRRGPGKPKLTATIYRPRNGSEIFAKRGHDPGDFQWSAAVRALTLLLLRNAAQARRHGSVGIAKVPTLCGMKGALANSLDHAMSQSHRLTWPKAITGSEFLGDLLDRENSGRKTDSDQPVIIKLRSAALDPARITVYVDGEEQSDADAIDELAESIERQVDEKEQSDADEVVELGERRHQRNIEIAEKIRRQRGARKRADGARMRVVFVMPGDPDNDQDKQRIVEILKQVLGDCRVVRIGRGSIRLELELGPEQVERLIQVIRTGELDALDVIDVTIVDPPGAHLMNPVNRRYRGVTNEAISPDSGTAQPFVRNPWAPGSARSKDRLIGGKGIRFTGSREFMAVVIIVAVAGVAYLSFWGLHGVVQETERLGNRFAKEKEKAFNPGAGPPAKKTPKGKTATPPPSAGETRVEAGHPMRIGVTEVTIVNATRTGLGALQGPGGLTITLQITNHDAKPITYYKKQLTLRDRTAPPKTHPLLDPPAEDPKLGGKETVTDVLVFGPTPMFSLLDLDLPASGSDEKFQFFIPTRFIQTTQ